MPPLRPHFFGHEAFLSKGGGGGIYFEPRSRNFMRPPSFVPRQESYPPPLYTPPHPWKVIFKGGGWGVQNLAPPETAPENA